MDKKQLFSYAFIKSIPIMCSYLFVSMAYGILMEESGFAWYYSLLVSLTVYTGAFQFVLTTLLSASASIVTIAVTAFSFVLFRGGRSMPDWMKRLGQILPSAIMAVLIVYCLKGAKSNLFGTGIPGIAAVLVVAVSYKWKHNTFISIIAGTAVYLVMLRMM